MPFSHSIDFKLPRTAANPNPQTANRRPCAVDIGAPYLILPARLIWATVTFSLRMPSGEGATESVRAIYSLRIPCGPVLWPGPGSSDRCSKLNTNTQRHNQPSQRMAKVEMMRPNVSHNVFECMQQPRNINTTTHHHGLTAYHLRTRTTATVIIIIIIIIIIIANARHRYL